MRRIVRLAVAGGVVGALWLIFGRESSATAPAGAPKKQGELGIASWYGPGYYGRKTANGETFTAREMTAAHKTLPFGTWVRVTDLDTGRSVKVRINDRGPFVKGRIIDLSERAAEDLGIKQKGIADVRVDRT